MFRSVCLELINELCYSLFLFCMHIILYSAFDKLGMMCSSPKHYLLSMLQRTTMEHLPLSEIKATLPIFKNTSSSDVMETP